MILLPIILMIFSAQAGILPDVFYAPEKEREAFCRDPEFQKEAFWRAVVDKKITSLIEGRDAVIQNSYVSLSYLELFQHPTQHEPSQFMGYVYVNASHHLGRLVRFHKWPEHHPLRKEDQDLVKGDSLRFAVFSARNELPRRLMFHSLRLYKELMWTLLPASLCGADYTLAFLNDPHLIKAYSSNTIEEFIHAYVTYEQSYLQKTMYQDWLIGSSAKAKVLDEMRFISFNGEEHPSFQHWCIQQNCQKSSYDLSNRILFDTYSIMNEYELTQGNRAILELRRQETKIDRITHYFLDRLELPGNGN